MAAAYLIAIAPLPEAAETLKQFGSWLSARKGLAATTVHNYVGAIRRVANDIGLDPSEDSIDSYVAVMREYASYAHVVNTSAAIERYAEFRGHTVKLGRPSKPKPLIPNTLSEAEISVMLAAARKPRDRALLGLLAYSGIRNAELCALRIRDVDLGGGAVHVRHGKGDHAYDAAIAGACVELLANYIRERNAPAEDMLFLTDHRRQPLEPQDVRKLIKRIAVRAGITRRVYPHLMRHSLAMNMLNRGAHVLTIKDQLGHAFVDTTMLYLRSRFTRARSEYQLCAPSYL